jgi:sterol desaturase/sphingolipid hydroxylase (fatty acid hydroxylase superfamily)
MLWGMYGTLMELQAYIHTAVFFASICIIASWESLAPRRHLSQPMGLRWGCNIALGILNTVVIRTIFPLTPVLVAVYASEHNLGFFNWTGTPPLLAIVLSLLCLDLGTWVGHYLLHHVALLWRLHVAHHSDPDFDFSTGLRFHPLEACYTWLIDALIIALVGAPAIAVFAYKTIQAFMSPFGHGNLNIHPDVDRQLRRVLITPDLHRIHHSIDEVESNSNYGGVIPLWDRIFGTYTGHPRKGQECMEVGLKGQSSRSAIQIGHVLLQPVREP